MFDVSTLNWHGHLNSSFRIPNSELESGILLALRQKTRLVPDGLNRFSREQFEASTHCLLGVLGYVGQTHSNECPSTCNG